MKILIAEDDTTSRLLLGATLKKMGHDVTAARDGDEAWDLFQKEEFPLLISDWMMPGREGPELCRLIRAAERSRYTCVLVLTARDGRESYLEAMDAGADDVITKPFDEDQLAARLRVAQRILDLHERLRTQALHDALTGLWNRGAILERLGQELSRATRENRSVGVVLADLDHFKQINDTHGHAAGDAVLREAAHRMRAALRPYDGVGRYGGEEFLMLVPGCGAAEAGRVAERVRCSLADSPIQIGENTLLVTSSLGVAVSRIGQPTNADTLVQGADTALYQAKADGRNRVAVAVAAGND